MPRKGQFSGKPRSRTKGFNTFAAEDYLLAGGAQVYFTAPEVCAFFGKSRFWLDKMKQAGWLKDQEGNPIEPKVFSARRMVWTADQVRDIAVVAHGRGLISVDEMQLGVKNLLIAEDRLYHKIGFHND